MNGYLSIRMDAVGPELQCRYCQEYWPLTIDHWAMRGDAVRTDRCRICNNERGRLYQALRRRDPNFRASEANRHRNYYRQWIAKNHPTLLDVYDRDRRESDRDRKRAA